MDFSARPSAEPLLRRLIFVLFEERVIARNQSIIDIGAWIGDNSPIWAKLLANPGKVLAIDPSARNLAFVNLLAAENGIRNIELVCAVCSGQSGEALSYSGDLSHTSFSGLGTEGDKLISTTIDEILVNLGQPTIGFMHLDVEGFELRVLRGAVYTVRTWRPVIVFEHHLRDGIGLRTLMDWFLDLDFRVVMINEILLGCRSDCRNFLAVPNERWELVVSKLNRIAFAGCDFYPAVPGSVLVELDLISIP